MGGPGGARVTRTAPPSYPPPPPPYRPVPEDSMPQGPAAAVCQDDLALHAPQQQLQGEAGKRLVGGLSSQPQAGHSHFFVELFSGKGPLTAAVEATGVPCMAPQDLQYGGADIMDDDQFDDLLALWRRWATQGLKPSSTWAHRAAPFPGRGTAVSGPSCAPHRTHGGSFIIPPRCSGTSSP